MSTTELTRGFVLVSALLLLLIIAGSFLMFWQATLLSQRSTQFGLQKTRLDKFSALAKDIVDSKFHEVLGISLLLKVMNESGGATICISLDNEFIMTEDCPIFYTDAINQIRLQFSVLKKDFDYFSAFQQEAEGVRVDYELQLSVSNNTTEGKVFGFQENWLFSALLPEKLMDLYQNNQVFDQEALKEMKIIWLQRLARFSTEGT